MIICCGEALIDMLPRQLPEGESVLLPVAGGAVYNTAIVLGRLGIETGFFSGLSTDMFGRQLQKGLERSNVDSSLCTLQPSHNPGFCRTDARPGKICFLR